VEQPDPGVSGAVVRWALCPACGVVARLDEEQLIYKRATCAVCHGEFELVPELFVPASPTAALIPVRGRPSTPGTALAIVDPPLSRGVALRDDGSVVLRATLRMPRVSPVMGIGATIFASMILAVAALALGAVGLPVVAAVVGLLAWPWRARLAVEGDALLIARGPLGLRRVRVPLAELDEIRTTVAERTTILSGGRGAPGNHLRIGRVAEYPLEIGARLNRDPDELRWAERQLTRAVRLARVRSSRGGEER